MQIQKIVSMTIEAVEKDGAKQNEREEEREGRRRRRRREADKDG